MDPNANLDEQLTLAAEIADMCERNDRPIGLDVKAARLADLVEAMDFWITGGGFLPARWMRKGNDNGR